MTSYTFIAYGHPQPKGSLTRMPNGAMVGGRTSRARDPEVRKAHAKRIRDWPAIVAAAAQRAWGGPTEYVVPFDPIAEGAPLLAVPVNVCARFFIVRPASKKRQHEVYCTQKPDFDKLLRGVMDPMVKAGLLKDDRFVVMTNGSEKRWAAAGAGVGDSDGPRVEITVTVLADLP